MVCVHQHDFPDHLLYDVENQIWYERLADGTLRAGFTTWAAALMGEILVFTPKRIGQAFERNRWFAMVEGGKWVGAARAAFDGVIVAHNTVLERRPELINRDAFGEGWMVILCPTDDDWHAGLATGATVSPAIEAWISTGAYKSR